MRRIGPLVAAMVAACLLNAAYATPPQAKYKVEPGAVVKKDPPAHPAGSVGSTFTLVEAADGDPPISVGTDGKPFVSGGACLLFQDTRHVKACTKQADCVSKPPAGPEGGVGYCHQASGTCWFKKDSNATTTDAGYKRDDYCLKSTPFKTLVVGTANDTPIPKGPPNTTRWRLTTCQGLTKTGCAGGEEGVDLRTRWGAVLEP